MCDEPGEPTMSERDDADDLGQAFLYLSKYYLLHRLFDEATKESQSAVAFSSVKEEAYGMLKQISRMKTEYESDSTCKEVNPIRLGFPLWKDKIAEAEPDIVWSLFYLAVWPEMRKNKNNLC